MLLERNGTDDCEVGDVERIDEKVLEFLIFAIESTAERLSVSTVRLYDALHESGLLNDYLAAHYDVLHTQGRAYIVDDLIAAMQDRGVTV